ncbi:MAG TPA: hypothetical protein DEP72_05875 [Clostridiales bacterium]|nr:MAG: hypothetical protein A2Y18_06350 [Clostridiales bacterium GWD2_32_19]HCC07670.1 hypothetical protein [Clostridiales bacterium]
MYQMFINLARKTLNKIDNKYKSAIYKKISVKYTKLYTEKEAKDYTNKLVEKTVANTYIGCLCLVIILLMSTPTTKVGKTNIIIKDNKIEKQEFKEGSKSGYLEATIKNENYEEKGIYKINVGEKTPTDEQIVNRIISKLNEDFIKGNNKSLSKVSSRLNLLTENDYGAIVTWVEDSNSINVDTGEVKRNPKGKGNVNVKITVGVKKGDIKKKKAFDICILEDTKTKEQIDINNAYINLDKSMKYINKSNEEKYIELPDIVNGLGVGWNSYVTKEKSKDDRLSILIIGVLGIFYLSYRNYAQLDEKIIKRKQEIEIEFCEFLNKFTLLIEAGLNIRRAMNKIVEQNTNEGYLYIELHRLNNDINTGVYEVDAYNEFAKRCNSKYINKFVSNLTQNIKRGNDGLKDSLRDILKESFENRKNMAKRKGEEASTKLIFPLVMVFVAIILLIIYPAVVSIKM